MDERFFPSGAFATPEPRRVGAPGPPIVAGPDTAAPLHDPPLEPRDEAVFLLTAAAEIEHALMAQYLYAAYSVRVEGPAADQLREVRDGLLQIAREEMGHLVTVQNLLQLVGGPLRLGREQSPSASTVHPFRFTLEPVTLSSLAKYVTAESPGELPAKLTDAEVLLLASIREQAAVANGGPVLHVGAIFARLERLFADPDDGLADDDWRLDTAPRQARAADWGFEPRDELAAPLIVESFDGADAGALRHAAAEAVRAIGAQGEGFDAGPVDSESHFERFFAIYRSVRDLIAAGVTVAWPVATNPDTGPAPLDAAAPAPGRITEPRARGWAQLFNLRYRLLLGFLGHFLRLDDDLYATAAGPRRGDRTARGLLLIWTFDEMRRLAKIAGVLVQLPLAAGSAVHAGPPFELPYTTELPDGQQQRWRTHLDASRAASRAVARLQPEGTADPDPFLAELLVRDAAAQEILTALADGEAVPADALPSGFAKVVHILEEAVRGFTIGGHGQLWSGRTRDGFLGARFFGEAPVPTVGGALDPEPDHAPILRRLEGTDPPRMPISRPGVPPSRIAFVRSWIASGCPDDNPPDRIGVVHEPHPAAVDTGGATPGALGFAADIRPLFRGRDRNSMLFVFDLHRYEDVRDNAAAIAAKLRIDMPCDGLWPAERIALFDRWVAEGKQP